jgi:hypothetical protein
MLMDDDIRAMSMKKIDANQIKKLAISKGMRTLARMARARSSQESRAFPR